MALRETALTGGATVTAGVPYVIVPAGSLNSCGYVALAPSTQTVAAWITALGLDGGTIIKNCDVLGRSHGAFCGVGQNGLDIFEL